MKLLRATGLCSAPLKGSHQFSKTPPELPLLTSINIYLWHNSAEKGTNPASDSIQRPWQQPLRGTGTKLSHSKTWLLPLFRARPAAPFCRTWSWAGQSQLVQGPETLVRAGSHLRFSLLYFMVSVCIPQGTRKRLAARRDEYA